MKAKNPTAESFRQIKVLITNCDLDPLEKGYLLMRINKVIRNKKSHFNLINKPTIEIASLFAWMSNSVLNEDSLDFWLTVSAYLTLPNKYTKQDLLKHINK